MYRECVLVHDAVIAISLVEASMQSSALTGNLPNPLHISFPQNPLEEYRIQAKKLLELLNLPELWLPEKIWLTSLTRVKRRPSNPPPPPGIIKSAVPKDNEGHTGGDSATLSRFFETGDDDEQTPCSLRIVTSTQKSNAPSKDAAQENYTEFLSPIAPSSARFRNVLRSPPTVDNSSTGDSDDSSPRQPKKRKRAATVFDESGIGSGDNELDRQIECMTPPPAEAVILKENVSDTNKPAGVSKFSSVLSRFRRDKD